MCEIIYLENQPFLKISGLEEMNKSFKDDRQSLLFSNSSKETNSILFTYNKLINKGSISIITRENPALIQIPKNFPVEIVEKFIKMVDF